MGNTDVPKLQPAPPKIPPLLTPDDPLVQQSWQQIDRQEETDAQMRDQFVLENFRLGLDKNADYAGRIRMLADELGMAETALHDLEATDVRRLLAERDFRARNLAANSPQLHAAIEDRNFLFGVQDDLDSMSLLEEITGSFEYGTLITEQGQIGRRLMEESRADPKNPASWPSMRELVKTMRRMDELEDFAEATGFVSGTSKFVGQMTPMFGEAGKAAIAGGFVGGLWGTAGGPLAPASVPAGVAMGAGAGFTASMTVQAFQVEGGNAFVDMLRSGYDVEIARQAGYLVGSINALFEVAGMGSWALPIKKGVQGMIRRQVLNLGFWSRAGRFGLGYSKALSGEIVTEIAQEITNIWQEGVARNATELLPLDERNIVGFDAGYSPYVMGIDEMQERAALPAEDPRAILKASTTEELTDRIEGIIVETFYGAGLISGFGPGMQFYGDKLRVKRAQKNQELLEQLAEVMQTSAAAERDPETVAEFFDQLRAEGPDFYLDPKQVIAALNDAELTVEQVDTYVPGFSEKIRAAIDAEATELVPVSSSDFTAMSRSELRELLLPLVRVDEEGTTAAEAAELVQGEAEMEKAIEKAIADDSAKREEVRQIEGEVQRMLMRTGMERNQAQWSAKGYALSVLTWANKRRMTPREWHAKRGLGVMTEDQFEK